MTDDSKKYLMLNTQKGLYTVCHSVCLLHQVFFIMDTMLKGLKGVSCYLDDILITSKAKEEHLQNLEAVLKHLLQRGSQCSGTNVPFSKKNFITLDT